MAKNVTFEEQDIKVKVNALLRRHRFTDALDALISEPEVNKSDISKVYYEWGNALLTKGDAPAALQKYIGTIGTIDSLQIIKKFSSTRHSELLLQYLQALDTGGFANESDKELLAVLEKRKRILSRLPRTTFRSTNDTASESCQKTDVETEKDMISESPKHVESNDVVLTLKLLLQEPERLTNPEKLASILQQWEVKQDKDFNKLLFTAYLSLWRRNLLTEKDLNGCLEKINNSIPAEDALVCYRMFWFLPGMKKIYNMLKDQRALCKIELESKREDGKQSENLVDAVESFISKFKKTPNDEKIHETIDRLREELSKLEVLRGSLQNNPIQYRNSICCFCKEPLKLPAIFFLCQHSFHKECAKANSLNGKCSECEASETTDAGSEELDMSLFAGNDSKIIQELSLTLANGVLRSIPDKSNVASNKSKRQTQMKISKNGKFIRSIDDYDLNFNPFENKDN